MKKISKFGIFLLTIATLTALFSFSASAASVVDSGTCGDNLTWTLYDDGELVIEGTGAMTNWLDDLSLPWYSYRDTINKVTIGDSVTTIGDYAFDYCYSLVSIDIPDSVTTIGRYAFYYCDSLASINVDSNNAHYSSENGVLFNKNKTTLVQYPIGKSTKSYTIPDSVTTIGEDAFSYCDSLESVTIGNSVTTIGDYAFLFCDSLVSIDIPDSVTTIGSYAFYFCDSLESVTIGNSVTTIGEAAFYCCNSLESVTIYSRDTAFGSDVFVGSPKVTLYGYTGSTTETYAKENNIPFVALRGITDSGERYDNLIWTLYDDGEFVVSGVGEFWGGGLPSDAPWYGYRQSIKKVTIQEGVTSVRDYAFSECDNLESITLPDSLTEIGDVAFIDCPNLRSVNIPIDVTKIVTTAFTGCTGLKEITVDSGNEYFSSADGVLFNKDKTTIVKYPSGKTATSYTIPDGVRTISFLTFEGCKNLESVVVYNKSITYNTIAFESDWNEQNITLYGYAGSTTETYAKENNIPFVALFENIPVTGVTLDFDYVQYPLFQGDIFLTATVYPENATNKNVTWTSSDESVATVENGVVTAVSAGTATITVTTEDGGYTASCVVTVNPSGPKVIVSGECGDNLTWTLYDDGELVIDGTGAMTNWSYSSTNKRGYYSYRSSIKTVTIRDSVTTIGDYAFYDFESLESVTIGNGVTSIGSEAFSHCDSLESVTIGNGVTSIGDYAFWYCYSLVSIDIPDSVTTIGSLAFLSCYSLESIEIPDSVTTIGAFAFEFCTSLKSAIIGNGVTAIGYWAFESCSALESVTIYSRDVVFEDMFAGSPVTLYGYTGSTTEAYATEWGIPFVALYEEIAVTGVSLNKTTTTLEIGETETLIATITPEDATNKNITWTSSDESVATVENGVVTAVSAGTATITVTTEDGGYTASCVVTVNAPQVENPETPESIPTIKVVSAQGRQGKTVNVVIEMDNNPGIALLGFDVNYNKNIFTLESVEANTDVFAKDDVIEPNLSAAVYSHFAVNYSDNLTGNGAIVTLTFRVNSDCADGAYPITITNVEVGTIEEDVLDCNVVDGEIVVRNFIPGDVNDDGEVNRMDLLRFGKYYTGWNVEIDMDAADTNGDGKVTRVDILRLGKYFAGWDVVLGKTENVPAEDNDDKPTDNDFNDPWAEF